VLAEHHGRKPFQKRSDRFFRDPAPIPPQRHRDVIEFVGLAPCVALSRYMALADTQELFARLGRMTRRSALGDFGRNNPRADESFDLLGRYGVAFRCGDSAEFLDCKTPAHGHNFTTYRTQNVTACVCKRVGLRVYLLLQSVTADEPKGVAGQMVRRAVRRVGPKTFEALSPAEIEERETALEALRHLRAGLSLTAAARTAGSSTKAVKEWAGSALSRDSRQRWQAKKSDRLFRRLVIVTPDRLAEIDARSSQQASQVARYMNAVKRFLRTGDTAPLKPFEGRSVAGVALVTDPDVLEDVGMYHPVSLESIYSTAK
jgi:hypothetical protein